MPVTTVYTCGSGLSAFPDLLRSGRKAASLGS